MLEVSPAPVELLEDSLLPDVLLVEEVPVAVPSGASPSAEPPPHAVRRREPQRTREEAATGRRRRRSMEGRVPVRPVPASQVLPDGPRSDCPGGGQASGSLPELIPDELDDAVGGARHLGIGVVEG